MFNVSERAGQELSKVLQMENHQNKHLVLYFMGAG